MGLGSLLHRSTQYQVTDTQTGQTSTFTVLGNLAPDWFGASEYRGGLGIPGAWRAANLLADLLSSLPWHAYRGRPGEPSQMVTPTPPVLDQPNPPDVRAVTVSQLVLDYLFHGNGIGLVATRNAEGWPTSYVPVPALGVDVRRTEEGVRYRVGDPTGTGRSREYDAWDVVHVKGPCPPGALRGTGVIENHMATLQLSIAQGRQASSITDAAVPTGVLKVDDPDLTKDDAEELKAAWRKSQATRSVAVLNQQTEFTPLAWDPSRTQLLDARRFSLLDWALIFGLPPSFLGADQNSRTYQNIEQEGLNLLKYSLIGHLARFEQELTRHLPRGTWVKANLDALLRPDTLTRYQAHEIALRAGFLTDDEVRALEDRPPLTPAQRAMRPSAQPAEPAPSDDEEPDAERARARKGNYDALHAYWTRGEGLARWVGEAQAWLALFRFLNRYMGERKARGTARKWFKEVLGRDPGKADGYEPLKNTKKQQDGDFDDLDDDEGDE